MPQLDKIAQREKKPFVKKDYRPWNLNGLKENPHENSTVSLSNKKLPIASNIHKVESKTKEEQLDNNQKTIIKQLNNNQITIKKTFEKQLDNDSDNLKITTGEQLGNALDNTSDSLLLKKAILRLTGLQKNILDSIIEICFLKNSLETGPLETKVLAKYIQTDYNSTKTSIKRLIEKGLLIRCEGRTARGGYINLKVDANTKNIILDLKSQNSLYSNPFDIISKVKSKLDNTLDNNNYTSSSNNINTTTKDLPEDWLRINFEPLKHIGFSVTQLKQLYSENLNKADIIQESINHFGFGLLNNPKIKQYTDPLNVLMGVLRKGQAWIEQNYRSPYEIAQEKFLAQKKSERERLKKLEEDAIKLAFEEWKDSISSEEIEKIAPSKKRNGDMDITPQHVKLSSYFKENIWPEKKSEYLVT